VLIFIIMLITGVVLICGCSDKEEKKPGESTQMEKEEETSEQSTNNWCSVGEVYISQQGTGKITGIEKFTFDGTTVDMCCAEISEDGQLKNKVCFGENEDENYIVLFDRKNDNWIKVTETYPKGDQFCTRMFNEEGEISMMFCD